jgi:Phage-integrase repeat unit
LKFLPFDEAKQFVHKLGLRTQLEWGKYCKSGKKPIVIPIHPERIYQKEWKGLGDWLGTGRIANQNRSYKTFDDALQFVHGLNLKSQLEWRQYLKSGNKPDDIPTHPDRVYKNHWEGWGDWLGTGRIANQDLKYRTFDEARTFVHHLKLKSRNECEEFCKSGKKPKDITYQVRQTYLENWKGWGDWLGTGTISSRNRTYRAFQEARQFVRSLKLNSGGKWEQYCKSGKKPDDIPTVPSVIYQKEWKGLGDWLGTGRIANQDRQYLTFEDAKKFVQTLGLKTLEEWRQYSYKINQ